MRTDIERLDRNKPPPGYELTQLDDGMWWWGETSEWLDGTSYEDRSAALAAARAYYQARNDPPGMFTIKGLTCWTWGDAMHENGRCDDQVEARAAAWRWYWRRKDAWDKTMEVARAAFGKTLADTVSAEPVGAALWPDILTWSDEKMASYEAQVATAAWKHAHG